MKRFLLSITALPVFFAAQQKSADSLATKNISEVAITKKAITKKADRLVFDVAASPVAKGNTAFGIVKETPLVSSTDDKNFKIAGKSGTVIYINGRKSQMNAEALETFLKSTPAENISKIEVITVPGSEFEVASSAGIINIILKKKMSDGTNGNLNFTNSQAKRNNQTASATLNTRKGKVGLSANFYNNVWHNDNEYDLANGNQSEMNISNGSIATRAESFGGYANMDYQISERQNVVLSYNLWHEDNTDSQGSFANTITNTNNGVTTQYYTHSYQDYSLDKSNNHNINLDYDLKIDENGSKLSFSGAYLKYTRKQELEGYTYLADDNFLDTKLLSRYIQSSPQNIQNWSALADFKKNYKTFSFGIGGNFNTTNTNNDASINRLNSSTGAFAAQRNHFIYEENIGGIYANVEKTFSEKFSAKAGLRMELTNSEGEIIGTDAVVKRKNQNILPTLNLNYNPGANHSISYAFTSRLDRPSFWELNPVREYLTETNYVQNNPFLKQSSVYNQELMYMYKSAFFIQIQNTTTKDDTTQVPLQKTVNGVNTLRYIRTNYGTKNEFGLNLGVTKSFFEQIWNMNYVLGLQYNSFSGSVDTDPITGEKFVPYNLRGHLSTPFVQLNNTIRLSPKKDWYAGVNYFYLGKSREDLGFLQPLSSLDLNLKKIWRDWTFALDARDILRQNIIKLNETQDSGYFNQIWQDQHRRRFSLSITYNFGNQKIQKVKSNGAANDIKGRTGG